MHSNYVHLSCKYGSNINLVPKQVISLYHWWSPWPGPSLAGIEAAGPRSGWDPIETLADSIPWESIFGNHWDIMIGNNWENNHWNLWNSNWDNPYYLGTILGNQ